MAYILARLLIRSIQVCRPIDNDMACVQIHLHQMLASRGHPVLVAGLSAHHHRLTTGCFDEVRHLAERDAFDVRHRQADEVCLIKLSLAQLRERAACDPDGCPLQARRPVTILDADEAGHEARALRSAFRHLHRGGLRALALNEPVAVLQQAFGWGRERLNMDPTLDAVGATNAPQLQPLVSQAGACLR